MFADDAHTIQNVAFAELPQEFIAFFYFQFRCELFERSVCALDFFQFRRRIFIEIADRSIDGKGFVDAFSGA